MLRGRILQMVINSRNHIIEKTRKASGCIFCIANNTAEVMVNYHIQLSTVNGQLLLLDSNTVKQISHCKEEKYT